MIVRARPDRSPCCPPKSRLRWRRAVGMAAVVLFAGCWGTTQFGAENHRLLASLQTAISARRTDWLEAAAKVVALRRASGQMSDEQASTLDAISAKAQQGDWQGAESEVVTLLKAQRAKAADSQPKPPSTPTAK
jgi:hypothetical protein